MYHFNLRTKKLFAILCLCLYSDWTKPCQKEDLLFTINTRTEKDKERRKSLSSKAVNIVQQAGISHPENNL